MVGGELFFKIDVKTNQTRYLLQKNHNFYQIYGEELGLKTIKRSSPQRNCNFHRFCTIFGFHTLAPLELFAGLLPKGLGASLFFCGKMFRVFTYQRLRHNAPHHINATDLRPFEYPSRFHLNPHHGKIGAKM